MRISFHGGVQEVTGACHLVETAATKFLVDCGLFQGCEECVDLNFSDFKFVPSGIDALVVTHAHLDHVGRIPKLVREGFRGKIYSTAPTRDLARLILEDALTLAEREDQALYTSEDIDKAFRQWEELPYHRKVEVGDVVFQLLNAGHILGSSMVELEIEGKHILFSGDLGNIPSVLLPEPDRVKGIEYLVIESAYGNRTHESADERLLKLERAFEDASARGGALLIPAFATERTQDILFLLNEMLHFRRVPEMPVFVDAPLAIRITEVFERYPEFYQDGVRKLFRDHPNLFRFTRLRFTLSVEESKAINDVPKPKAIIAGSGMMNGGRILHHAQRYLADPKSILLIMGYQAAGSLGRRLLDGTNMVRLYGNQVFVQADVRKINGFSAHADNPQLYAFVEAMRDSLKQVFVVQGESAQAEHLAQEIKDRLGIPADVPMLHQEVEI